MNVNKPSDVTKAIDAFRQMSDDEIWQSLDRLNKLPDLGDVVILGIHGMRVPVKVVYIYPCNRSFMFSMPYGGFSVASVEEIVEECL